MCRTISPGSRAAAPQHLSLWHHSVRSLRSCKLPRSWPATSPCRPAASGVMGASGSRRPRCLLAQQIFAQPVRCLQAAAAVSRCAQKRGVSAKDVQRAQAPSGQRCVRVLSQIDQVVCIQQRNGRCGSRKIDMQGAFVRRDRFPAVYRSKGLSTRTAVQWQSSCIEAVVLAFRGVYAECLRN